MKKYLFLPFALLAAHTALAQSNEGILSGDYNSNGKIDVGDVTYMNQIILGNDEFKPVYIDLDQELELTFSRPSYNDPTGTFPQLHKFDEGTYIQLWSINDKTGNENCLGISLQTVEDQGRIALSSPEFFTLRQKDVKYSAMRQFWITTIENNKTEVYFNYSPECYGYDSIYCSDFDFAVSQFATFTDGKACFNLYNVGSLVRLSLSNLPANTYIDEVRLTNVEDQVLFAHLVKAELTDSDTPPTFSPARYEPEGEGAYMRYMRIFTNNCRTNSNGSCNIYLSMGPADLTGKSFYIDTYINDVRYRCTAVGQKMESNQCYTYVAADNETEYEKPLLALGGNNLTGDTDYYFVPEEDGFYTFNLGDEDLGALSVYQADFEETTFSYQMKASYPYSVYANRDCNVTITKLDIPEISVGDHIVVSEGKYYLLSIPADGYYYFTSETEGMQMRSYFLGDPLLLAPTEFNCYRLSAGIYLTTFTQDGEVNIGQPAPLTLDEAKEVKAGSYLSYYVSKDGFYTFASDTEDNFIEARRPDYSNSGSTPVSWYFDVYDDEPVIIKVRDAGTLTISEASFPVIALDAETTVLADQWNNRGGHRYQFVVTEKGIYHVQLPEGNYGLEVYDHGSFADMELEPGTYFVSFMHYDWGDTNPKEVTVSIRKTADDVITIDDPLQSNTVVLSTAENPVYYRFKTSAYGFYKVNVGAGCCYTTMSGQTCRFIQTWNEDGDYEPVCFYAESDGTSSLTATTFSLTPAVLEDMPVNAEKQVYTDRVYKLTGEIDTETDYFFSAANGFHISRMNDVYPIENFRESVYENTCIYFYHDDETKTSTTASVMTPIVQTLTLGEFVEVEIGRVTYEVTIPDDGQNYTILISEGCLCHIEGCGTYGPYMPGPGTYRIYFYSWDRSMTTAQFIIGTEEELTPEIALNDPIEVTYGITYKFIVEDTDYYTFSIDEGWSYDVNGSGMNSPMYLEPGTYTFKVWRGSEAASDFATFTVRQAVKPALTVNTPCQVNNAELSYYTLEVPATTTYQYAFDEGEDWYFDIRDTHYNPVKGVSNGLFTLEKGTYYVLFGNGFALYQETTVTLSTIEVQEAALDNVYSNTNAWRRIKLSSGTYDFDISISGWTFEILGYGEANGIRYMGEDYYLFRLKKVEDSAADNPGARIRRPVCPEITFGESVNVVPREYYNLPQGGESRFYHFYLPEGYAYWIEGVGSQGDMIEIYQEGPYVIYFYSKTDYEDTTPIAVTIENREPDHASFNIGERVESTDKHTLYTATINEPGHYFTTNQNYRIEGSWNWEDEGYFKIYNESTITIFGNGKEFVVSKLSDLTE